MDQEPSQAALDDIAGGQKMVIWAIVLNVASLLTQSVADLWIVLGIAAIALGISGLLLLAKGLGYSTAKKVGLVILAAIPLIGLLMLVMVNARATKVLKEAGYRVGLLGARRPA